MQCKNCGTMVPDGRERCHYCNAPMPPVGPAPVKPPKAAVRACTCCGKDLTEGDKFCKYCGTAQEAEPVIKSGDKMTDLFLRLCPNCGMEIKNDDQYCAGCGQEVKHSKRKSSLGPGRVLGIVACLITVVLVTILIVRLVTNTPEAVVKNHIEAIFDWDAEEILDQYPPKVIDARMWRYDYSQKDLEEEIEEELDEAHAKIIKNFSKDWSVDVDVIDTEYATAQEIDNYNNRYHSDEYYAVDVEDAARVEVEIYIRGGDEWEYKTKTVTVLKIDGSWYVDIYSCNLL